MSSVHRTLLSELGNPYQKGERKSGSAEWKCDATSGIIR